MILSEKIAVSVEGSSKYGLNENIFYPVIGSRNKTYFRDGNQVTDSQFIVINEENRAVPIFINKCKIKIM
jgi:hypothetical protein